MTRIDVAALIDRFTPGIRTRAGKCKALAKRLNDAGIGSLSWKAIERWLMRGAISRNGIALLIRLNELEGSSIDISRYIRARSDYQASSDFKANAYSQFGDDVVNLSLRPDRQLGDTSHMPRRSSSDGWRAEKQEFVRLAKKAMRDQGLRQSDVALRMYGERKDNAGRIGPAKRDYISRWLNVNVKTMPTGQNLRLLETALNVDPSYFVVTNITAERNSPMDIRYGPDNIAEAWIVLNMRVSAETAIKVQDAIRNDPIAKRIQ